MDMPKQICIQIRRPLGGDDTGQVEIGHYVFVDGVVTLTDEDGNPLRRGQDQRLTTRTVKGARDAPVWSAAVLADQADHQVAGRLLHTKFSSEKSGTDFNRPLPQSDDRGWR
jgi:hypothetical protein